MATLTPDAPGRARRRSVANVVELGLRLVAVPAAGGRLGADLGADVEQLREEGEVQGGAEEADPGGAARAALVADDALHGLHVTEAPELEGLLDVDELLAHLVGLPVALRGLVDRLEHR